MNYWINKKIIIIVLIIIVGKVVISSVLEDMREENYKTKHGQSVYSPDRKNKAVYFNENGGGGISPYCVNIISVVPANTPDYIAYRPENNIYVADCHQIGIQHTKDSSHFEYDPIINWISNNELGITFAQARVYKTHSSDGNIQIIKENYREKNIKS